jgi:hypothetical protein
MIASDSDVIFSTTDQIETNQVKIKRTKDESVSHLQFFTLDSLHSRQWYRSTQQQEETMYC